MLEIHEKYRIIKTLGFQKERKFGSVYLIENKLNGSCFVMKTLHKNEVNTNLQERLRMEAQFNFDFKGLPQTIDQFESDNEIFIIKSYLEGIPLDEFWKTVPTKQKSRTILTILKKLALIMNHLDESNIIHCDIKPSNILISQTNEDINVSLIDFGLAINKNINNTRSTLFPLGYASPELLLNKLEIVDHRSDLFSLGIVIWKLFTDKLPLTHPNPAIFTNLQITHPLPDSNSLPKGWYPFLNKLCNKYQFKNAPNKLKEEELIQSLKESISKRYKKLDQFILDIEQIPERRKWIFF